MINTKNKVYFYDDRAKDKSILTLKEVLFENETVCLCKVKLKKGEGSSGVVLFNIESGEVLNTEYDSWYATNDKNFLD